MDSWSGKKKDFIFVLFGGLRGKGFGKKMFLRASYIGNPVK